VLLTNTSGPDALVAARHIQNEIWSLAVPHAETASGIVTVSLGVSSLVPSQQHIPQDLVQGADSALYRAKHVGTQLPGVGRSLSCARRSG
jgi:diguanylate cyclase (GGDEF)-like protein